jgi:flavin reductase (DIM6/NTAB) family NADH-FMN oxidoreductase RutF
MKKITLGPQTLLYPMPAFIIGANVDDQPNFMTAAWCGIANSNPPMLAVALQHHRYTYRGVRQTNTFSVNVPSVDLVKETDYCGIVTGSRENKTAVCKFTVVYGKLKNAPLIEECPVNLECTVVHTLNLGSHALLIGQIEETHVSLDCLTDGQPDVEKIKPIVFSTGVKKTYHALGELLAEAFSVGTEIKKAGKA